MAQEYPFSFTDDSAPNVGLPTLATDIEKRSPSALFQRSVRPSLFLFDLRREQSAFFSRSRFATRQEWSTAYTTDYISQLLSKVDGWHSSLPSNFSQAHLQHFYLEFLYSKLLVASPNPNNPISRMTDVNKAMVVHFAIQYVEQLEILLQDLQRQAFLTYQDVCRAQYAGRQFKDVIWSDFDKLLRNQQILMPDRHNSNVTPVDNCSRAITFINKVTNILGFARSRWGIVDMRSRFEHEIAVLLARLSNKQQEFSQENFQPGTTTYTTTQPGPLAYTNNVGPNYQYDQAAFAPVQMPQSSNGQFNDMNAATHRSNLFRGGSWSGDTQQQSDPLQAVFHRHSYDQYPHNSHAGNNQGIDGYGNNAYGNNGYSAG